MAQELQVAQVYHFTTINISLIILSIFFIILLVILFNKNVQRKNKFILGGIFIVLIIFTFLFPLNYIPFSETNGKITDLNGNALAGVKVGAGYFCFEPQGFVDSGTHHLGSERAVTTNNGEFTLNKFSKFQMGQLSNCQKSISAFKEGYGDGDNLELGIRELSGEGLSNEQINNDGKASDSFYYLLRDCNGKYYDSMYFSKVKQISSKEKQVTIQLTKIDLWFQC